MKYVAAFGLVALYIVASFGIVAQAVAGGGNQEAEKPIPLPEEAFSPVALEAEFEPVEPSVRYALSDGERDLVERIVYAEAGGEDYDGQRLIAQCILNACEKEGHRPGRIVREYQYASPAASASYSVKLAVSDVFDCGYVVTHEPVLYFYAPRWCRSPWHESQVFVLEHGGHRFFKEAGQ